jgi:hypothetical protein
MNFKEGQTTMQTTQEKALSLLKHMLGEETSFRSGQWDAIMNLVIDHKRVLLFQKTVWGTAIGKLFEN